jgi:hypothetical protein
MIINVHFENGGDRWCHVSVYQKLLKKLTESNKNIKFNFTDSIFKRTIENYSGPACKYGPHFMILENEKNKKYFLISYWDKLKDVMTSSPITNWDIENRVEVFASSGTHVNDFFYKPLNFKYTPMSYTCMTIENEKLIDELYHQKNKRIYLEKPTFRGYLYQFRSFLESDDRFDMKSVKTSYIGNSEYMKELDNNHLNFSVNGAGEVCNRDIEILGLGTALFRTKLVAKFHNELIPNYHYISVDFDDIPADDHKHDYNGHWKILSDRVHQRFMEVKDDHEYIKFVSENGRKWYEENGTVDANVNIIYNLLDFKKLK